MATLDEKDGGSGAEVKHLERLNENLARVEELSQRMLAAISRRTAARPQLSAPDPAVFTQAIGAYWSEMMRDPAKIFEHQLEYWGKSVKHYIEVQQTLARGAFEAPEDETPDDPRFGNPLWKTHPYFNFIKQQYMLNAQAIGQAVEDAEGLSDKERRRLTYFSRQIVDMMAPTNFLATNPDALERAAATEGQSLVDGLENLVRDIEANDGEILVRLADENAFKLGENIAVTPGKVVFRNHMMELIQYAPVTEEVHATPLIIFPPWINKFYILDLTTKNSLIKWITEQGFTLFVASWVNPDETYKDVGLEDYIEDGFLAAIREVKAITEQPKVNVVGYCIGGTALAMTLSLMKKRGDKSIKSATFFTALTDFSDQGEFTPFLQDDFIDGIEAEVQDRGVLRSHIMARTFSFLRSNDLVYRPAIRSYMMGESPPAFDLLFWNGDGTNLPARMAVQYLRDLCQGNRFTTEGQPMLGETLHVGDIDLPVFAVTCQTDHIAAWRDCYRGTRLFGTKDRDMTFVVSESGHIAGIVNPPSKKKYGHYTNPDMSGDATEWFDNAQFTEGSWWPRWGTWLVERSGKKVPARVPGDSAHPALCDAPGTYVRSSKSISHAD